MISFYETQRCYMEGQGDIGYIDAVKPKIKL